MPIHRIESFGFSDMINMLCWRGNALTRPVYTPLTALPGTQEQANAIADFFDTNGNRHQVIITPTRVLLWNGAGAGSWTQITGVLTPTPLQYYGWTVVAHKLLFSQGVDKVQSYDGLAGTFAPISPDAVPAKYLMELDTHLVVANTIEGGNAAPQRVRWTGAGDPTDWISFNAGQSDRFNDLGPIVGLGKLYQIGYVFFQLGIEQMIPTGVGVNPFEFAPLSAKPKGSICPFSIAIYGDDQISYVGKDNIYMFNGTQSIPIGDAPLTGSPGRLGARKRIYAELAQSNLNQVFAYTTSSINGNPYNAYWLVIPTGSTWMFNFDEGNWTRHVFDRTPGVVGTFARQSIIRIIDLIGTIAQQTWTPATLTATAPLDAVLVGFADGTQGLVDFTNSSETSWSLTSGQVNCSDVRHNKTVNRFRINYTDIGPVTFNVTITIEKGVTQTQTITVGHGFGCTESGASRL